MHASSILVSLSFILLPFVSAQGGTTCSTSSPCKQGSAPCCSEFGFCGDDSFCLGGCNPRASLKLDSCKPNPICKDATYNFTDNSRILTDAKKFDGNASRYDFVVESGDISNTNGELAMMLTQANNGTRLSSTRFVHYGTITAKLKTSRANGVVVAFITMSNIKDEIDWEFPGSNTTYGQSNVFWQGVIPTPSNGGKHGGISDTYSNYHEFGIDWQKDALNWLVDGKVVRTVKASDFTGAYPTTPSRVQISIWPAGIPGMAQGTVDWAGGMIDWNNQDYTSAGHYAAYFQSISVKCNDPNKPSANDTGYVYSDNSTNPSIGFSTATTLLANAASDSDSGGKGPAPFGLSWAAFGGIIAAIALVLAGIIACCVRQRKQMKKKSRAGIVPPQFFGGSKGAYAKVGGDDHEEHHMGNYHTGYTGRA